MREAMEYLDHKRGRRMNNRKAILILLVLFGAVWGWSQKANALKAPHNSSRAISCSNCHSPLSKFRAITSFDTMCFNQTLGCHNSFKTGTSAASKRKLSTTDASNRFGSLRNVPNYATYSTNKKQSSHGWRIPNENLNAGATNWDSGQPFSVLKTKIYCSRCHMAHGESINRFLRDTPRGDKICLDCHTKRRVTSVKDPSVISAGNYYSHPVEVNYSSARGNKPAFYEVSPTNPYPSNASAELKLFTTIGGLKGAVICSTCHGPIHSSDSNPYTYDNLTTYSKTNNYSTSAGNLLRRYPLSTDNNICTSCHAVKTHQGNGCGTCHEPHKKPGDTNIYLIKRVIATPYGNHSVFFTSTSQMAKRFKIYSTPYSQRSNAVCQVCHRLKSHHRAYSTVGADRIHNMYSTSSGWKSRNCTACHPHNATADGFKLEGGCAGCHGQPPADTYGRHGKHTNDSASHSWKDGKNNDARSTGSYGFACGRCHNPWTPYTATVENYKGIRHYTDYGSYKTYTADMGFANGTPLPANDTTKAGYNFGARGSVDNGPGTSDNFGFNTPASGAGTCKNIYCHGQFYNGYTANDPIWNSTGNQPCGKCHGVAPDLGKGIPGNTGGSNWGAHPRHVGNAGQQYGTAGNFRCNACHVTSATQNAISSVGLDRRYHVNGRINVQFDAAYGYGSTKYGNLNNYSAALSTTAYGTKTAYKTCELTYCHSDGSRILGNYSASNHTLAWKFPNWSSSKNFTTTVSGTKRRCARCHGSSYTGITSSMPGYGPGFRPDGKGNSHLKHVQNGFLCNVCHSLTVGADNKSIASTAKHVNKVPDVDIIARYGGSYDYSGTKRCSNVKCHGGRVTAVWGDAGKCQDCHFKSTAETTADKGYRDNYAWMSMTSTASVPRIYSTEWMKYGHGATAAYPNSGNSGANKVCTTCHKQSGAASHSAEMTNNPFRVYTAAGHIDDLCQQCHASSKPNAAGGGADRKVLTHYTTGWSGWGTPRASWPFMPKCIDCHDPHGDNNNRYMIKAYINYSGSLTTAGNVGKRNYDQNPSVLMAFSTAGGNQINWSSYVKSSFTGICQRCHGTQTNMAHFRKYSTSSGDGYDASHNPKNRCTGCHKHDTGFKGADCGACHYFPPVLSGRHTQHTVSTVTKGYPSYDFNNTANRVAYGCGKCHDQPSTQHIENATPGLYTTEVVFDGTHAVPKNPGANYAFGAKSSFDPGADGAGGYTWVSTKGTCRNLYCHGQFFGGYTGNDPNWYNNGVDDPQTCGKCHGAVKNASGYPTGGAHVKHLDTTKYNMPCKTCHREVTGGFNAYTVTNRQLHVNGVTNIRLYTSSGDATVGSRIGRFAKYGSSSNEFAIVTTNTNPTSAPAYRYCLNTYCHSRGTSTLNPYTSKVAYPNYTAQWGKNATQITGSGKECSLCHGNKNFNGITAAMPFQTGQAHKVHVVDNNFTKCYICHSNVVDSNNNIVSTANHVNKFKNISVIKTYKTANEAYSGQRCSNIKCHGGRITPTWTTSANCQDCHYSTASPEDDFTWRNYSSGNAARIYSSEWVKRGHGKTKASGKYPFSNNTGAGKVCGNCHTKDVKHNQSNYFRLLTATGTDSNALCTRCHGSGSQLKTGFGRITGIQSHTWQIISTEGYKGGASGKAGWNNPAPKCVDCHDPHGDANNAMLHTYINMTGSDTVGSPSPTTATAQVVYTAVGGQINWSSFTRADYKGICQRCHSPEVDFFDKAQYGNPANTHNNGQVCKNCHKHRKGFAPSGCDSCHGYPPPDGPTKWTEKAATPSTVGLHQPHAINSRNRPGIPAENDLTANKGYKCNRCHGGVDGSTDNGQSTTHGTGVSGGKYDAGMKNMTMVYGKWSKGTLRGYSSVTDDTCSKSTCHTPRNYTRTWKKPTDCNGCHGTIRLRGATERAYNLQTTMSHKIHINYTGVANPPAAWGKNYRFACTNCHYNVGNNYSTHYSGQVNITSNGPINTVGGQFYTRGRSFKGFTTGGEVQSTTTCTKVYCHGNFTNGTTTTKPSWKKGATTLYCIGCHKAKTARIAAWTNGTTMPARHPKHVRTSTYNFACSKCHVRTVSNNTTVFFQYSAHVNGQVNVVFDSVSGTFNGSTKSCLTSYCHSRGDTQAAPYSMANYTAKWTDSNKGCNYCHGNKTWAGITAAMPAQPGQAHVKHAHNTSGDNFKCYVCHANVVNSAGAIISYTNHVNKFKNISIILTYKSGATNYNPAGTKKCDNVKCHGGRTTPAWTASANCQDCHYGSTAEDNWTWQNYSASAGMAQIYSSEWTKKGHASYRTCTNCHTSSVKHGTATNPFRLFTSDPDKLCAACHGSGTGEVGKWGATYGNKTGIKTHSASATNGDATWPSSFPNQKAKCVDCHDPHGDRNRGMIQSYINMTGSDPYGRPNPTTATAQMIFTTAGSSNLIGWSSFVKSGYTGICQRCHNTQTNMNHFNKAAKAGGGYDTTHNIGKKCTDCHKHKQGFKGGGESTGGQDCGSCHSTLYQGMKNKSSFHHVMRRDASSRPFPSRTDFAGNLANYTSTHRRCLMCHVDHNSFNRSLGSSRQRAKNLRVDAYSNDTSGVATDFWPAKRKNSQRTGSDAGSANYSSTYPVSGPAGKNGVCISCHNSVQYKNTTEQRKDRSSRARPFAVSLYTSSSHNYQVISGFNNFSGRSSFRANCTKCHKSSYIDKKGTDGQLNSRFMFGLHDANTQGLLSYSAARYEKPRTEELCFKCHSQDNYQNSNYDYYSSVKMSSGAKMIKTAIEAKTSGHPVDNPKMEGRHVADEFYNVTGTVAAGANPPDAKFWNFSSSRHVECVDCHNTHGGNASIRRYGGGPFLGKLNTSDTQKIYSAGNKVAGSQAGAWGVSLSYGATPGSTPTFSKVPQVKRQYELCLKCHSNFAYGANPRGVPSGLPDSGTPMTGVGAYQNLDSSVPQDNVAASINPNNYGYHPIYKKGKNQPSKSLNTNWPTTARSDWKYKDLLTNRTAFIAVSGLSWTFVPPYSQHSLLACSDCHQADNSGQAAGKVSYLSTVSSTNWANVSASTLGRFDDDYAYTTATGAQTLEIKVKPSSTWPDPTSVLIVVYGYSTDTTRTNRDMTLSATSDGATSIGSGTKRFSTSNGRYELTASTTETFAQLNDGLDTVKLVVDSGNTGTVYVDYMGLEGIYATTSDVRGPHGSLGKWLLTTVEKNIWFDANNDGNLTWNAAGGLGTDRPNGNVVAGTYEAKTFCYNCHRRDVYGSLPAAQGGDSLGDGDKEATYYKYSRISHPPDGAGNTNDATANTWGIWCMNCHGGGGIGEIHGSFANSTTPTNGSDDGGVDWGSGAINMQRPRGVRLLNGALFALKVDPANPGSATTNLCYTPTSKTAFAGKCDAKHAGGTAVSGSASLQYSYNSW